MATSILERLIDNRIAALRTITKAGGYTQDIGHNPLDGDQMTFQESPPFSFWKLDEELPDPEKEMGRYVRKLRFWVGGGIEYAGLEAWRQVAMMRADLQRVMGLRFSLVMPVQAGGEVAVPVQVKELGHSSPVLDIGDPNTALGMVQILYEYRYETSRSDPGIH